MPEQTALCKAEMVHMRRESQKLLVFTSQELMSMPASRVCLRYSLLGQIQPQSPVCPIRRTKADLLSVCIFQTDSLPEALSSRAHLLTHTMPSVDSNENGDNHGGSYQRALPLGVSHTPSISVCTKQTHGNVARTDTLLETWCSPSSRGVME